MASHDIRVDVLSYGYDDDGEATLDFLHHVHADRGEIEDSNEETGARRLDDYVRFISVQEDLLFVAHFSGTITVWNWKQKRFLTKFRGHLNRKTFASPIKSLKMNGLTIAIGFLDDFVAILRFDDIELQMRGYIDPILHGYKRGLRAVDIHEGSVAVGYEDAILVWDLETMTELKFIPWENEELVELHFNSQIQKILVGNTFGHQFFLLDVPRGQIERRFSLPDDTTMTTISTDWRKYVVAGTWEAAIYVWSIETELRRPVMIYQTQHPTSRPQSSNSQVRSYRASGIGHLNFNGVYLTFIEQFGTDVKFLDFMGKDDIEHGNIID